MTTVKKFTAKVSALLLALSLALLSVPQVSFTVFADDDLGSVRVIVENTTFTEAVDGGEAPAWIGTKVDKWVSLDKNSSAMTCIKDAIESSGFTQTGADAGYISEIAGLKEKAGGSMSGWMGTLNDWFTNEGFDAYTVANGKLTDGDELRMQYTMNWGADLGSDWSGTDTSLKAINSDYGTLSPEFGAKTYEYTLTVPFGTKSVAFKGFLFNIFDYFTDLFHTLAVHSRKFDHMDIFRTRHLGEQSLPALCTLVFSQLVRLCKNDNKRYLIVDKEVYHHYIVSCRRVSEVYQLEYKRKVSVICKITLHQSSPALFFRL